MRKLVWLPWWLAGGFVLVAITVYWSLAASPVGLPESECDKCGHVIVYFVLMAWFAGQVAAPGWRRLAGALMLLGVSLEMLQTLQGGRFFEFLDLTANAAGIGLAWLTARMSGSDWCGWLENRLGRAQRG